MTSKQLYEIALGDGRPPYGWQLQFADGDWPTVLIAPTGAGKTAGVTLGWAHHRLLRPDRTPRRLVWCFPMRVLAEQTKDSVVAWLRRLKDAGVDPEDRLPGPGDVHVLMGGVEAGRWLDYPERPCVLVGTQDMLLSRALMRGYASSRALWPIEFAFLHEDAQWVFDEVQLMGAGRATSTQLEGFRLREASRRGAAPGCPSRSLWISATLEPQWLRTVDHPVPPTASVVRVVPDRRGEDRLARLSRAVKRLSRSPAHPASANSADMGAYLRGLAEEVLDAHRPDGMTLVIVNRVARAQELHAIIRKRLKTTRSPAQLSLIHSRFRAADREREMRRVLDGDGKNRIVIATQAVEAGVDISARVMFTELAPWPSMVQRFGRANRYAELASGAEIHWVDLIGNGGDPRHADHLALPYSAEELAAARDRLATLPDAAPAHLGTPGDIAPPRRVIRWKDLTDLFDTDPDLTGFDVDISPYIRDATDTDVRVFWRSLTEPASDIPAPTRDELCAVPIRDARAWLAKVRTAPEKKAALYVRDPQWRRRADRPDLVPGWKRLREAPWPGLTILATVEAGGYSDEIGFTGALRDRPAPIVPNEEKNRNTEADGHDEDPLSTIGRPTSLEAHLRHAADEAAAICAALGVDSPSRSAVVRASRWHDVGKGHSVFQQTMHAGLDGQQAPAGLLAKTVQRVRHGRPYFRHELASALAFLDHESWNRDADLVAYLIAAHHGKVRMNLRALPRESPPSGALAGKRFARGIWEDEGLPPVNLGAGETWRGGAMNLSIMELGHDDTTGASWTERTRALLARHGPFQLAWLEALVRIADWRASGKEQQGKYSDE